MAQAADRFLAAEENAEQLVAALTALRKEITSYKTATKDLDQVRQSLLAFVEATQQAAKGTNEAIQLLRSIGAPQILDNLNALSTNLDRLAHQTEEGLRQGQSAITASSTALRNQLEVALTKAMAAVKQNKTLILVNIGLSAAAVVLSLVALFH